MVRVRHLVSALAMLVASPAAAQTMRAVLEVTDLSSIALSPDQKTIVYRAETPSIERNTWDLSWWSVPADGSAPPHRISGAGFGDWYAGSLEPRSPVWSADSGWIYYRAIFDGQAQVWRARPDGSRVEQVTHDDGDVTEFALAGSSGHLVYAAGPSRETIERAEQREYDEGVRVDASIDAGSPLVRGAIINGRMASERFVGRWFRRGGLLSDAAPHWSALDLAAGTVRAATLPERALVPVPPHAFDRLDDRQVTFKATSPQGHGAAYILADGKYRRIALRSSKIPDRSGYCDTPQCTDRRIDWLTWVAGANAIVFQTFESGGIHFYRWDLDTGAVDAIANISAANHGDGDAPQGCAANLQRIVCIAAAANQPPHLLSIDTATGSRRTLADPNHALINPALPRFVHLEWPSRDGTTYTGEFMRPLGVGPFPLFITYYVCDGFLRGGTGDEFPLRQLVARGIAVLCINRPVTSLASFDQQAEYRLARAGIEAGVAFVARQAPIDRRRVGMGGLSFGGEVTAWMLAHGDLLAAASISSTVMTPTYYWFNALPGRDVPATIKEIWKVGDPDSDAQGWKILSPALNTKTIHAPLLMQMPEQEYRNNLELMARLGAENKAVDLWAFPGEGHIKTGPRHKLAVYERNLDWFCYWLLGEIDPSPAKRAQYALWQSFAQRPKSSLQPDIAGSAIRPRSQASISASSNRK